MTKRVLLVASRGGHWVQLSRLAPTFEGLDVQYVCTSSAARAPMGERDVITVVDASKSDPLRLLPMAVQMFAALQRFRPDFVVTTGAAPGVLALWLAKCVFGATTVWVDSIANAEKVSLSARLVARVADLRLTQWSELVDEADGIQYFGAVI